MLLCTCHTHCKSPFDVCLSVFLTHLAHTKPWTTRLMQTRARRSLSIEFGSNSLEFHQQESFQTTVLFLRLLQVSTTPMPFEHGWTTVSNMSSAIIHGMLSLTYKIHFGLWFLLLLPMVIQALWSFPAGLLLSITTVICQIARSMSGSTHQEARETSSILWMTHDLPTPSICLASIGTRMCLHNSL